MSEDSANPIAPQSSAKCGVGGFTRGTLVWGNLGLVAVDELRPGDRILVIDARSGAEVFRPVTEAFEQADKRLVSLVLGRWEIVGTHPDQPYRLETNEIKPAHEVAEDDVLVTAGRGRARVRHNVQLELKSVEPLYGIRVEGGVAVFIGRQGLLASIGDHAAVTPDHQRPAGRSPHSQRKG